MKWHTKKRSSPSSVWNCKKSSKLYQPTRADIKDKKGVKKYCRDHKLNNRVQSEMVKLVTGEPTMCQFDTRDLRTVSRHDRVPRSLEAPVSPVGYWDVTSPRSPESPRSDFEAFNNIVTEKKIAT